jgi:hypothetical protein
VILLTGLAGSREPAAVSPATEPVPDAHTPGHTDQEHHYDSGATAGGQQRSGHYRYHRFMPMINEDGTSSAALAAKLFRGLADPTRLGILLALQAGERRVVDLVAELGGSQANVSGHLACLKDCGLVADRAQGRANLYRLAAPS